MTNLSALFTVIFGVFCFFHAVNSDKAPQRNAFPSGDAQGKQNTSACDLCELLVNSFNRGMERTARERFDGGNTAWEEKNLGSYATSETRLVEIQEGLCGEDKATRQVCQTVAEIWEHHLENWWFRDRKDFPDLRNYLCETVVRVCKPSTDNTRRCPTGFTRIADKGCFDVDECLSDPCERDEFCSNEEGSFTCGPCHVTCDGCLGSGPGKCKRLKRKREKRSVEEMLDDGKLLNFNAEDLSVLLLTVFVILVPCVFCILVPALNTC